MLLQKPRMFAQLSDCWWENTVLRRKNTDTLASACGLGLEDVTLSDGATFSSHPGAKNKKNNYSHRSCSKGMAVDRAAGRKKATSVSFWHRESTNLNQQNG